MSLLPKSIHRCRRYPTKFNSGRDIPGELAVAALVVPTESSEDHAFVQNELDAAEKDVVLGNREGAAFDFDIPEPFESVVFGVR